MNIKSAYLTAGAAILAALGIASCGSDRNNQVRPPTGPAPAPVASVVRIELIVPASIPPGESVQLTANAVKSDNSVENVTSQARWNSSDTRVVAINASGLAQANARGEAIISASYTSRGASTRTLVLPAGTYRLSGLVTDTGIGLAGVTVTVIEGVEQGLNTITDGTGRYALYGVRDRVVLQAKRDGYSNRIEQVDVGDHRTLDFGMLPDHGRPNLQGRYRVTFTRAPCSAAVPETRSYDGILAQDDRRLTVTLSGADFIVTRGRGNAFSGVVDGDGTVTFAIGDAYTYYYYYGQYDLVERITSTSALVINGTVTARPTPTGISGTLNGGFQVTQGVTPPFTRMQAWCFAASNRFEMVRQ